MENTHDQIGAKELNVVLDKLGLEVEESISDHKGGTSITYSLETDKENNWGGSCFRLFETRNRGGTNYVYYDASVRTRIGDSNPSPAEIDDEHKGNDAVSKQVASTDIVTLFRKHQSRYDQAYKSRPTGGLAQYVLPQYELLYDACRNLEEISETTDLTEKFLENLAFRRSSAIQPHDTQFQWRISLPTGWGLPDMTLELLLIHSVEQVREAL